MNIEAKELSKIYGEGENRVTALNRASLTIAPGDFISIMGPSGSGKSTLLHLLSGLDRPTSGHLTYDGKAIYSLSDKELSAFRRQRIGFIFQQFHLLPVLTARENITMPLLLDRKQPNEGYLRELAQMLGIQDRLTHLPHELSGGQQQRVAIARALALHPDILCFDEPTSALDPELTGEVLRVIRSLAEQKTTMIIVTHEMAFARDVADQLIFMDSGVIVEQGDPKEVIDHPKEERTRQFLARYADN